MKSALTTALLIAFSVLHGQAPPLYIHQGDEKPGNPKITFPIEDRMNMEQFQVFALGGALSFLSGLSYGVREVVQHHPNRIPESWNEQWWDTRESWKNKYRYGDPKYGRNLTPIFATDAYHAFGMMHRWTATGAGITLGINLNSRKNEGTPRKIRLWQTFGDALIYSAMFQAGFLIVWKTDAIFDPE